ncbi:translation elongation factor Ts [bacterium]|nr:translation elongation factor Ts [bacterium]NIN93023.1 translation elongation factor Ts [bacterium]NIO18892.1 translation elongation factor Ts [bacterium]NIO73973.1 translation elongation factor Ts [bacterium]
MQISKDLIRELRNKTGAGVMDCKQALSEAGGDIQKAQDILRAKGSIVAIKRSARDTKEGLVSSYVHSGSKLGVLLEMNCETDFVAKTSEFSQLAKELAMQIAAMDPLWIKPEDVPKEVIEKEKEIYKKQAQESGKPEKVIDKIAQGRLEKYFTQVCLLEQPYIKDPKLKVKDLITETVTKLGENIRVGRFTRFKVGEE